MTNKYFARQMSEGYDKLSNVIKTLVFAPGGIHDPTLYKDVKNTK